MSAVQGNRFTFRIELMLASDIVVAVRTDRGETRDHALAAATIRMTERAGLGNALRYLLPVRSSRRTALRLGFVQEVVAPGNERQRTRSKSQP